MPISLVGVGIALASHLASWVMSRKGRRLGHLMGLFLTQIGVVTAGVGIWQKHFYLYTLGCTIAGMGGAFNNQVRFTAAENAGDQKALVHSWILMFSLFAAFFGPWMIEQGHTLLAAGEYLGSLTLLSSALMIAIVVMFFLPSSAVSADLNSHPSTSAVHLSGPIWRQFKFWLAALSGIAGFATMTLLMTATPLQMHTIDHFSHSDTTATIRSHIVAMYFPSLFSGVLIAWLGIRKLIVLGVLLFFICIAIAYSNSSFHHYWWALVLLGVGWNILYLAGSTWVSQSYSGADRFAAQGANDLLVYGVQSIASLAAGWLLFAIGWKNLVLMPLPFLLGLLILVAVYTSRERRLKQN